MIPPWPRADTLPRRDRADRRGQGPGRRQVTFKTAQAVSLWPLKIIEAEYLATRAAVAPYAGAAGVRAAAGLRLRFASSGGIPLSKVAPPTLPIYIDGSETIPGELYRQIAGETLAVIGRSPTSAAGAEGWVKLSAPEQHGFEDDCALLPAEQRSFRGYRLLSEYFACPERFLFVRLNELGKAFASCDEACDVVLLFGRNAPSLAKAVSPGRTSASMPARRSTCSKSRSAGYRSSLTSTSIRSCPTARSRSISRSIACSRSLPTAPTIPRAPTRRPALRLRRPLLYDWREALFYVTRLRHRRLSTKEQRLRKRTDYLGTETWLSLTAPGDATRLDKINELAVRALVTNRELPELLRFGGASDFTVGAGPVRAVTTLRAPTRPQPPMGLADGAWRVIGHLTPNYATLAPEDNDDPSILRDHLALYGRIDDPAMRRQIDGVLSIRSPQSVTRRVPGLATAMAFARGLRIKVKLDDVSYDSARMFLFSAVLERFMAEFATINSFTECVFESVQEGQFIQWPPRLGQRRNI